MSRMLFVIAVCVIFPFIDVLDVLYLVLVCFGPLQ